MDMNHRFYIERSNFGRYFDIRGCFERGDGVTDVANPVSYTRIERDALEPSDPMLRVSQTDAQQLMDELWRAGLRPSEGSGSAGALAATERHLKDMQRLVFEPPSQRTP